MKLTQLHEEFIDAAHRPMLFGQLPVNARHPEIPLVAVERWRKEGHPKALVKKFTFRRSTDRNLFVVVMMEYEEHVQHHARLTLDEGTVEVKVCTKDIDQITEMDKEYSTYCDAVFKDLVNAPDSA